MNYGPLPHKGINKPLQIAILGLGSGFLSIFGGLIGCIVVVREQTK